MWKMNRLKENVPGSCSHREEDRPVIPGCKVGELQVMKRTKGLKEYVQTKEYRERMGLPGQVTENYTMLAQGEYNRNYTFIHPITGKKLVLRINFGSQMHLKDQILYEYKALKLLENSGRTPKAIYADGSCQYFPMVSWSWNFCLDTVWIIKQNCCQLQAVWRIYTV